MVVCYVPSDEMGKQLMLVEVNGMRNRKWSVILAVLGLVALGVAASAMPEPTYFCQDDFTLSFGATGNPLAAGTELVADGRLLHWNDNKLAGWFSFDAVMSQPGQISGNTWTMTFDSGTFTIHSTKTGGSNIWTGTIDHFTLTGFVDPDARYDATTYPRPSYESEPTEFISVGDAAFTRLTGVAGGSWTDPKLVMPWAGSYNWNYDQDTPQDSDTLYGNLQAKLAVPEPAGIVALLSGIVGLAGFIGRRRN
jgi:hypothetical protein